MTPADPRHGSTRGYSAGCRALCCRRARNMDEARRRKYRQVLGITRSIDAVGTRRRIHALMAIGWTSREIAARCGWSTGEAVLEVSRRSWVQTRTSTTIARVYDDLCMRRGPSDKTRIRAIRKGWLPPLAWDDIDDPNEQPCLSDCGTDTPDEAVVVRVLGGERSLARTASPSERCEITARWAASGRSLKDLARLTGWKPERYWRASA